jgi:hypothetical protein
MGWNDRLVNDPYEPTDEERQRYDDWCEYQEYLKLLAAELEQQTPAPTPETMGLSSQTIDPDCYGTYAIDIFGQRESYTPTPKEQEHGKEQESASQDQEQREPNHQD